MSCTVFALPYALAWIIGAVVVESMEVSQKINCGDKEVLKLDNHHFVASDNMDNILAPCGEKYIISEKQFLEKKLKTPFNDKNVLIKTLSEHGIKNLRENEFGQIRGSSGSYELMFERDDEKAQYFLIIKYLDDFNVDSEVTSINNEYAINVQEQSYNQIIENLKNNNMEIEDEEIQDDNTIVITVNVD